MRRMLASAAVGYLAGTVPSAQVAAQLATGGTADLRRSGTGNPGAVNAMAVIGRGWGSGVLAADVAKAAAACAAGARLAGGTGAHVAGAAAVLGHCFPVWSRFKGGKGVAASCGQCLATFPVYVPFDLALAWGVGRWKGHTLPATVVASVAWVGAATLWWQKGWPNAWGPAPTAALPAAAAVSSAAILYRFATGWRPTP